MRLLKLFENPVEHLVRVERMKQLPVTMGIITHASPRGWGAIQVKVDENDRNLLHPIEAVEAFISETEAELLEVEFGESASQAVMEAYAVLRALDLWRPKTRTRAMFIRSDSVVALGMSRKLSSPHASLNFLAAEMVLRLEKFEIQKAVHHHLRGKWNQEADWLSHLRERGDTSTPGLRRGAPQTGPCLG